MIEIISTITIGIYIVAIIATIIKLDEKRKGDNEENHKK